MNRSRKIWDFRVEVEVLPDGKYYRTRITSTKTKRSIEKRGTRPLWDVIRLMGEAGYKVADSE